MNPHRLVSKLTAGILLATLVVTTLAPAAEARSRHGRRYKGAACAPRAVHRACEPARVVEVRGGSSCGVPAFAGFIGGLALGAVLSRTAVANAEVAVEYRYYDRYCDDWYGSLDGYRTHVRDCGHPRIVEVIDAGSGRCVHTYRYHRGEWEDWDDD